MAIASKDQGNEDDDRELFVDKCGVCETFFVVTIRSDLSRRTAAHELAYHGAVNPTRTDHSERDYR